MAETKILNDDYGTYLSQEDLDKLIQIAAIGGVIGGFIALAILAWAGALGDEP